VELSKELSGAADTVARQSAGFIDTVDLLEPAREALAARGVRWSRLVVHATEVADPLTTALPDAVYEADLRQLGVGVSEPTDASPTGLPIVVLIFVDP
jgi:hypothetical protein